MMTAPNLSQKQLNFARFSIVCVDIIKLPLKDILNVYIKPTELDKNIKSCPSLRTGESKLNPDQQRKCCFIPCSFPDYSKFDVPLLYKLIRNLCPTLEPTNKWGNKPTVNDVCVGDDIERIRVLRNAYFAHTESAEISDDEFKKLWHDVKCVVNRCQQFTTSKGCKTDYNQMLTDLERRTLTFKEYTSGKERSGAIYVLGDSNVLCGETASLEAEITLEEDLNLPISWDRVEGLSKKQLDIKKDKYRGSNSRQLLIHHVCKDDEAGYQAVISRNQDVKIFSNKVYLRALGDPPCLEEMDVSFKDDEIYINYEFKVSEQSPFVKEIRWTKNILMLDSSSDKYRGGGLADKCITITSPREEDKGEYTCTVSNAVGSVSKTVKLDIPSVDIPSKSKVTFGSETGLFCRVSGYPPPNKVEWQSSVDRTTFHPIDIDKDKYFGSSTDPPSPFLLVRNATLNDQQYYRIVVSNVIGKCISSTLFLQVTGDRPNISEGICTVLDRSVKLRCDVFLYDESPPLKDVYWTKNGEKLFTAINDGKYSGVNTNDPSLTINNVNYNDAGSYQLTAVNAVGETRSEVILLGVPDVHLEKFNREEDGNLNFRMTIKSVPVPYSVQWSIKEKNSDSFEPININAAKYKGTSHSFPHPVLVTKLIERPDNCIFEIEVKNRIGEVKRRIPGEINEDIIKRDRNTVGKFYIESGSRLPFGKLFVDLANNFPTAKTDQLKDLIQFSCNIEDVPALEKATSARECFKILWKEGIFTPSDIIAMQFLLQATECEELEQKCIKYARMQNAWFYYETPSENGYRNVRFHVVADLHNFSHNDEIKIKETVASIAGCSLDDIRVHGYLHSTSFFIVLSIKNIYIERLMAMKQHDKDKLKKLNIDYFEDGTTTILLGPKKGEVEDEHKTKFLQQKRSCKSSMKINQNQLDICKSARKMMKTVTAYGSSNQDDTDEIATSNNALFCRSSSRYINIQKELEKLYSTMQDFVIQEEFLTHIKNNGYGLQNIEEKLRHWKNDVRQTGCTIVIAGETGSGKSSIINMILGEEVLPTGITACTSSVCRIKYCERYMINTIDILGEKQMVMTFENEKEMADKLKVIVQKNDEEISYIDIYMPVPLLQGNVVIIDTPGFGNFEQSHVAEKMMHYLSTALSFVFVLNVSNAGGLHDRLLPIFSVLKEAMYGVYGMESFSSGDVFFLLNKWDVISHEDDNQQEQFFQKSKNRILNLWEQVKESFIFKCSAIKVSKGIAKYTRDFNMFRNVLKEVISRNENTRVTVHLRILGNFLGECKRIVSTRLSYTMKQAEPYKTKLDELQTGLEKLEEKRNEAISNIEKSVGAFIDEASNKFQDYLHHPNFKAAVLQDTDTFTRFTIGKELNIRIENLKKVWQKTHIEHLFQRTIVDDLVKEFDNICCHSIEEVVSTFDVKNMIFPDVALGVKTSGASLFGSLLRWRISTHLNMFQGTGVVSSGVLSGIVSSGFEAFNVLNNFDTFRDNAFKAKINAFTIEEIKRTLRKEYFDSILHVIKTFLQRDLDDAIVNINALISKIIYEHRVLEAEKEILSSLQSTVIQNIARLQQIEKFLICSE